MNWKSITVSTILGGILLFITTNIVAIIVNIVAPFDIFAIGGMRAFNDPVMALYFVYPFVFALIAGIVYDVVRSALGKKNGGVKFGLLLFLVTTVPSMFMIYSTMTYPTGFYIANILYAIVSLPLLGMLFSKIWAKFK